MKAHPSSIIKFQEEKEELEKVSNTIDAIAKTKSFIKNVRTLWQRAFPIIFFRQFLL